MRLIQKRRQLDPKLIKKHSQIVRDRSEPLLVVGDRTRTDYGYTIPGVFHKSFETLHMVIAGTTTPLWEHPKKLRVYRVVAGTGHFQEHVKGEEDCTNVETKALSPGDEVVAEPGRPHRLVADSKLDLYVTQDYKYEANLVEVMPVERIAEVSNADLQSLSSENKMSIRDGTFLRRGRTKAVEQIAAMRGEASARPSEVANSDNFFRNDAGKPVNVMPVLNFSEDGAG